MSSRQETEKQKRSLAELTRDKVGNFHLAESGRGVHPELLGSVIMRSELARGGIRTDIESDLYNLNTKGRTFSDRTIPDEANAYFIGEGLTRQENKSGSGITMHYYPVSFCKVD